jgi:Tol biopolymer transport system component
MAKDGTFYFISTRSYDKTASTIYRGHFANGTVSGVELVPGVSREKPGIVEFDAEISADGETLYYIESDFGRSGHPKTAVILYARRQGDRFVRADDAARILGTINTKTLNYAPAISADGLELFFTRVGPDGPAIYAASRAAVGDPFGAAKKIEAIAGFVEGPTISPDGRSLYYHKRDDGRFVLYRVMRK